MNCIRWNRRAVKDCVMAAKDFGPNAAIPTCRRLSIAIPPKERNRADFNQSDADIDLQEQPWVAGCCSDLSRDIPIPAIFANPYKCRAHSCRCRALGPVRAPGL